ncbi:MAG: O-phosphoserine--tRNA ligase [Candidatus Alkanophagales archaeon]
MRFDPKKILEEAEQDFERAWLGGKRYVSERPLNERFPRTLRARARAGAAAAVAGAGKPHPVFELVQRLREAYLRLGFEEVVNPVIIEEAHVHKQFGKEAFAILDRCFYLAGLPRPDIGIPKERIERMEALFNKKLSDDEIEMIKRTMHRYKKGEIDGDDLVFEIARSAGVSDGVVAKTLDEVFPELRGLAPEATRNTLRSHMTAAWFITLSELCGRKPLPIKLFSVDRCFRREQREGPTRLMSYFSASCVLCDEDVSVEDGKEVAFGLLSQLGFSEIRFRPDEKRSKYYVPDTQTEVFVRHERLGWVEVATFGIYSPTALAHYDIPYPVMNLGLGVERLAMVIYGEDDVRRLVYPQFYKEWTMSDLEIASLIRIDKEPLTEVGRRIAEGIVRVCEERGRERAPCEFLAFKGTLHGVDIEVSVVEPEENTLLCGPAYLNELVVCDGSILGVPRDEKWRPVFERGVPTGIRYVDGFAALAAHEIERFVMSGGGGENELRVRVRVVRSPSDVNVKVDDVAVRYITSKGKKIDVRGPMFTTVRCRILNA